MPNSSQSSDIGQISESGIFNFRISGQNSKTSDNIDMKLEPVTELDKRNNTTSKKFDDDQFGVIQKLNSRLLL